MSMRSRYRVLAWGGLAAFGLARLSLTLLEPETESALSWILSLGPMVLGVIGAAIAYRMTRDEERRFWGLLTVAVALVLAGEVHFVYTVIFVDPLGVSIPHPLLLVYAGAFIAFLAILTSLTRFGSEPAAVRLRFHVDVLVFVAVAYAAAYRWIVGPLFAELPEASTALSLLGAAYPVVGLTLVLGTLGVIVGLKAERWQSWERLFALSLIIYSVGILAWPWWYADRQMHGGMSTADSSVDVLFMAGFYLLFMAAVYRLTEPDPRSRPRSVPAPVGRWPWFAAIYLAVAVAAVPALALASARAGPGPDGRVYLVLAIVLASLLGARSWLVALEESYLIRSATTDPVTGLPNRRAFEVALPRSVDTAAGEAFSVVAFDVDGFSGMNEIGGQAEGDRILMDVAREIRKILGRYGALYRLGGDDLIALLPGCRAPYAATLASESAHAVERSVRWGTIAVSVSAGVAAAPDHGTDGEVLVRKAMSAQQWARAAGGARTRIYDDAEGHLLDPDERLERIKRGDHLSLVRALASAVDARDPNAPDHSRAVARHVRLLAREVGMSEDRVALVETAGLLHDIGKLAVDDRILAAPRVLTSEERARLEDHPVFAEKILRSAGLDEVLPWVRHHHERWDGTGYPDGCAGEEIPLEARIIAIADAYEVMTSGRPYQPKLSRHAALRHIELEGGTCFDPTLAAVFVRIMWHAGPPQEDGPAREVTSGPRSAE